jgi:hypothetical protein
MIEPTPPIELRKKIARLTTEAQVYRIFLAESRQREIALQEVIREIEDRQPTYGQVVQWLTETENENKELKQHVEILKESVRASGEIIRKMTGAK